MVYAKFGGQTECIMGNWQIENIDILKFILSTGAKSNETKVMILLILSLHMKLVHFAFRYWLSGACMLVMLFYLL